MGPVRRLVVTQALERRLREGAARAAPREFCALLSGSIEADVLILDSVTPVRNHARDPGIFVIRAADLAPLAKNQAFFHSHVDRDSTPSMHDRRCSTKLGGIVVVGSWSRAIPHLNGFDRDHGSLPVSVGPTVLQQDAGPPG